MASKTSTERILYQVSDTDEHGILIDLLGRTLERLTLMGCSNLKWSVFDLDWTQRQDGILHWERVCERSSQRPYGWQLDDSGIRLFHTQSTQVTDGLFLAGAQHAILPDGQSAESVVLQSKLALQVVDGGFWRLSCDDQEVAKDIVGSFRCVEFASLVAHIPTG